LPNYLQITQDGLPNFAKIAQISIHITASSPVRIIGQSVSTDGLSGDMFTILPVSALGMSYSIALNAAAVSSTFGNTIFVIATQDNTNISASVSSVPINAGDVYQLSLGSRRVFTTSFSADKPLAVVLGSQCLGLAINQCDYRATMPLSARCGNNQENADTHPVLNLNSVNNNYIIVSECGSGSFKIDNGELGELPFPDFDFKFNPPNLTHVFTSGSPQQPILV
jgi:hypothetical protein